MTWLTDSVLCDVGDVDHRYADALIEALAPHDVPDTQTLCNLLRTDQEDTGWLEIFLVDLAGERRVRETVPILVEKYRIDTSYLLERCSNALAKIGDPEAVRLIGEAFPNETWHYRNYTSSLLPRIKHPHAEQTIIQLLNSEKSGPVSTWACWACFPVVGWISSGRTFWPADTLPAMRNWMTTSFP